MDALVCALSGGCGDDAERPPVGGNGGSTRDAAAAKDGSSSVDGSSTNPDGGALPDGSSSGGDASTTDGSAGETFDGSKVASLAAGVGFTCALSTTGRIKCWGANTLGQLGAPSTSGTVTAANAKLVNLGARATAISAVGSHACALLQGGAVRCWGANEAGELGVGTTGSVPRGPQPAVDLGAGHTATAIAAGGRNFPLAIGHTCALLDDGSVKCWGGNGRGQLGIGGATFANTNAPTTAVDLGGARAKAIAAGATHTCALLTDGMVRCWGDPTGSMRTATPFPVDLGTGSGSSAFTAVQLAANDQLTCALIDDSPYRLKCWGSNSAGQLGIGSTGGTTNVPTNEVQFGSKTPRVVAAGAAHACVIASDQNVRCWGSNAFGQLGTGTTISSSGPASNVELGLGRTARAIATGELHTCVVLDDGSVRCFGRNNFSQVGPASPAQVETPTLVDLRF
jgi:alpha-tubulin suppressor-like RCC1 family protein